MTVRKRKTTKVVENAKPLYVIHIEVFEDVETLLVKDVRGKADSKAIDVLEKAKLNLISLQ
jgi:hypothetical protein